MKIIVVKEIYLENPYRPMCGTCAFRGQVSVVSDTTSAPVKLGTTTITGVRVLEVKCEHPDTPEKIAVDITDICDKFKSVNDILNRIFMTKRLI